MAINNNIGREGSPSRPNPKDGAFGEHALPITWIDKMKENPMKQSMVVAGQWSRPGYGPLRAGYGSLAVKENVMSDAIGALMRIDAGLKL